MTAANFGKMELSKLSWSIRGTLGRKLLRKSLQYTGVVDFTLGDPDIPTPDGICKAAIRAIKEHKTRYIESLDGNCQKENI